MNYILITFIKLVTHMNFLSSYIHYLHELLRLSSFCATSPSSFLVHMRPFGTQCQF